MRITSSASPGEQVAAARAAVCEQPDRRSSRRARSPRSRQGRSRRSPCRSACPPSGTRGCRRSCRAGSRPGWRRSARRGRSPTRRRRCVPSASQRRHVRRVAVAHRPPQHGERETVDLQEDEPGRVGPLAAARAPGEAPGDAQRVRVVVVRPEDDVQHDADSRGDQRGDQRPPEAVDLDRVRARSPRPASSIAASRSRITPNPASAMNGIRRAATIGGMIAFRTAIASVATAAPPKLPTSTAGTSFAAISRAAADEQPGEEQPTGPEARPGGLPERRILAVHDRGHRKSKVEPTTSRIWGTRRP